MSIEFKTAEYRFYGTVRERGVSADIRVCLEPVPYGDTTRLETVCHVIQPKSGECVYTKHRYEISQLTYTLAKKIAAESLNKAKEYL